MLYARVSCSQCTSHHAHSENPEGETDQGSGGDREGEPGRSGSYARHKAASHKKKSIFARKEGAVVSPPQTPNQVYASSPTPYASPPTPSHHGYAAPPTPSLYGYAAPPTPSHHGYASPTSTYPASPTTPHSPNPLSPRTVAYPYDDDAASSASQSPRELAPSSSVSPRDVQLASPSYTPRLFPTSGMPVGMYGDTPRATPFHVASMGNSYTPTPLRLAANNGTSPHIPAYQLDGSHSPVFPPSAFTPRAR